MTDSLAPSATSAAPSLRLRLPYDSVAAFVDAYAPFVARAGMFLPTSQARDAGSHVRFEIRLANDAPVLVGEGVVRWVRAASTSPPLPGGMGVQFSRMTRESRDLVMRLLSKRQENAYSDDEYGLPLLPVALVADAPEAASEPVSDAAAWGEFADIAARVDVSAMGARARQLRDELDDVALVQFLGDGD